MVERIGLQLTVVDTGMADRVNDWLGFTANVARRVGFIVINLAMLSVEANQNGKY